VFVTQASADHHESDAARFEQLDSVKAFDEFQAKPPRGVSS
jgi:hypothetical protein